MVYGDFYFFHSKYFPGNHHALNQDDTISQQKKERSQVKKNRPNSTDEPFV